MTNFHEIAWKIVCNHFVAPHIKKRPGDFIQSLSKNEQMVLQSISSEDVQNPPKYMMGEPGSNSIKVYSTRF